MYWLMSSLNSPQMKWMPLNLECNGLLLTGWRSDSQRRDHCLQGCLSISRGRNGRLSPSAFKQLPISVCVSPQYSFISLVLGGGGGKSIDKPFFNNNPNDVSRILFKIQGACLSYPISLWEASKYQRNVKLCVH